MSMSKVVPDRAERAIGWIGVVVGFLLYGAWEWLHRGLYTYDTRVFPLDDADEWRYTACSRAVEHGYHLFTQVFSAQPPLLFISLAGGMSAFSDSISGARVVEVAFGGLGLVSSAWIGWLLAGEVGAGVATLLLAISPLYLIYSRAVEAEGPMMALVTLGLACALAYYRSGREWLPVLAGLAIAAAVLFKLFALAALAPALWLVVCRHTGPQIEAAVLNWLHLRHGESDVAASRGGRYRSSCVPASAGTRRPASRRRSGLVRAAVALIAAAVAPLIVDLLLFSPGAQWDQVIRFHEQAASLHLPNLIGTVRVFSDFFTVDAGLTILALVGLALTVVAGRVVESAFLVLWAGGFVAMLAGFHPVFPHHTAILLTALGACAASGAGAAWDAVWSAKWARVAPFSIALAFYLLLLPRVAHDDRHALLPWDALPSTALAAYIHTHTSAGAVVATDDLAAADLSGRLVAPPLCDPSNVRLLAGYMPATTMISATKQYRVQLVAPRGTYLAVPGYLLWLRTHFTVAAGPGGDVYLRKR
jgi:hypothetical protein